MRKSRLIRSYCYCVITALLFITSHNVCKAQEASLKKKFSVNDPKFIQADSLFEITKDTLFAGYTEIASSFLKIVIDEYTELEKRFNKTGRLDLQALSYIRRAEAERRLYEPQVALNTLKSARSILEKGVPRNNYAWFRLYYVYGELYHRNTDYYIAASYLDTAQIVYNKIDSYDSADYKELIDFKFYAYLYADKNLDTLRKYADKRLELERYDQNKSGIFDPELRLFLKQDFFTIYENNGEFFLALAYAISNYKYALEHELTIKENFESTFYRSVLDLSKGLYNLKEYDKALKIALETLSILSDKDKTSNSYYEFNLLLGDINSEINQPKKAIEYYSNALNIEKRFIQYAYNDTEEALALMRTGINLMKLGKIEEAEIVLFNSLDSMQNIVKAPNPQLQYNYESIGDFYETNSELNKALNFYDTALFNAELDILSKPNSLPETDSSYRFSLKTLEVMKKRAGLALKAQNNKQAYLEILSYIDKTHDEIKRNRDKIYQSDGKLFLSEFFKGLYETGISTCFELYQIDEDHDFLIKAHKYIRMSKANLLQEQSKGYYEMTISGVPYGVKEDFYQKNVKLDQLKSQLIEFLELSATSDSVLTVNEELLRTQSDINFLRDSISKVYGYNILNNDLSQISLVEELSEDQLFVEYFFGEEFLYTISKDADSNYNLIRKPINDEFLSLLRNIIQDFSNPPDFENMTAELERFKKLSYRLYQILIESSLENRENIRQLVIVPDDLLTRIPYEALIRNNSGNSFKNLSYLVKDYKVKYLFTSNKNSFNKSELNKNKRILGIGYSSKYDSLKQNFLVGTEKEVQYLNANFEGEYYTGQVASKQLFLDKAQNFDILHLAVHGKAVAENRFQNQLIFNGAESNILYTSQLYMANLKSSLAVLSACESGIGAIEKGEGTFSIARGFAIVGVPNIIMSLWEVNDGITSRQMSEFYKNYLEEGNSINESLANMKVEYLETNDSYSCHPYYWASFVHLGIELDEESAGNRHAMIILFAFIGVSMLVIIGIKKRKGIQ